MPSTSVMLTESCGGRTMAMCRLSPARCPRVAACSHWSQLPRARLAQLPHPTPWHPHRDAGELASDILLHQIVQLGSQLHARGAAAHLRGRGQTAGAGWHQEQRYGPRCASVLPCACWHSTFPCKLGAWLTTTKDSRRLRSSGDRCGRAACSSALLRHGRKGGACAVECAVPTRVPGGCRSAGGWLLRNPTESLSTIHCCPPDVAPQLLRVLHALQEPAVLLHTLDAKRGVDGAHLRGRTGSVRKAEAGSGRVRWSGARRETMPAAGARHRAPSLVLKHSERSAPTAPHRAQQHVVAQREGVVLLAVHSIVAAAAQAAALAGGAHLRRGGRLGWGTARRVHSTQRACPCCSLHAPSPTCRAPDEQPLPSLRGMLPCSPTPAARAPPRSIP